MKEPRWIARQAIVLLHAESLVEHGGASGVRDEGLLDFALARLKHLFAYEPEVDLPQLAAAYALGLTRNHPFIDGNKRAGFLAAGLFLGLNKSRLVADHVDATRTMLALSTGEMTENDFAAWIRNHKTPA